MFSPTTLLRRVKKPAKSIGKAIQLVTNRPGGNLTVYHESEHRNFHGKYWKLKVVCIIMILLATGSYNWSHSYRRCSSFFKSRSVYIADTISLLPKKFMPMNHYCIHRPSTSPSSTRWTSYSLLFFYSLIIALGQKVIFIAAQRRHHQTYFLSTAQGAATMRIGYLKRHILITYHPQTISKLGHSNRIPQLDF